MLRKMPKPALKVLAGLIILGTVVVACNNKKKDEAKPANADTGKVAEPQKTEPTTPPVNDSPMMKKDTMPVVPDH